MLAWLLRYDHKKKKLEGGLLTLELDAICLKLLGGRSALFCFFCTIHLSMPRAAHRRLDRLKLFDDAILQLIMLCFCSSKMRRLSFLRPSDYENMNGM